MIQKRRSFLNFFFGFLSFRIPLSMSQFLITSHWISSELMTARRKESRSKLTISVALIKSLSASGSLCFISKAQSAGEKIANVWYKQTCSKPKIIMVFMPWVWRKDWCLMVMMASGYCEMILSINLILSETTLEFMLGQDEIFVRAKIQREFEYFDELNIIHNERSEFWWCLMSKIFKFKLNFGPKNFVASRHK